MHNLTVLHMILNCDKINSCGCANIICESKERNMVKKEYLSRKDLNSRETLAYEYMLDGLSLKRIAKSTGYQWNTIKRFKSLWFDNEGNSRLVKF